MSAETSLGTEHADHPLCVGAATENERESTPVLIVARYVNMESGFFLLDICYIELRSVIHSWLSLN